MCVELEQAALVSKLVIRADSANEVLAVWPCRVFLDMGQINVFLFVLFSKLKLSQHEFCWESW